MGAEGLEPPEPEGDGFTGRNATNYVLHTQGGVSLDFHQEANRRTSVSSVVGPTLLRRLLHLEDLIAFFTLLAFGLVPVTTLVTVHILFWHYFSSFFRCLPLGMILAVPPLFLGSSLEQL